MMTWLKLLVRRQNHQSNEMNRQSALGKQQPASLATLASSINEDCERRSTRPNKKCVVAFIETSTNCKDNKSKTSATNSRVVAPENPMNATEEKTNIAKSIETAQKVRPTAATAATSSSSSASQTAGINCGGGSKSRDRRRGCLGAISMQSIALSPSPVAATASSGAVASRDNNVEMDKLADVGLDETKELRLPKLVQEQHETAPSNARCQCTKSDNNKNMHKTCWPTTVNQKSREGLREGQSLTNCQGLEMMKVAPRATSFHCDKTPAWTFAAPRRPADESSKTSQVVVEDEEKEGCEKRSASKSQQDSSLASHKPKRENDENFNNSNKRQRPLEPTSSVLFKPKSKRKQLARRLETSPAPILVASGGRPTRSLMLIVNCCLVAMALFFVGGFESPSALVGAAEAPKQTITVHPEPRYFVQAGQQVKLPCQVANRQGDCAWLGTGGKIVSPSGRKYIFARSPADGDCAILIRNASVVADDGYWQCQALAADAEHDNSQQSRSTQLVVLVQPDRPQIKDLSQRTNRLILEEKKEKNVTCEIRGGNPAPQIEWYLDGKLINQNVLSIEQKLGDEQQKSGPASRLVQSRLLLGNVKRSMNGKNLTCVGVHQTQNQTASIELDVQYVPSASLAQKEYTLVEGSPLTVPCLVDANPPASHISWRFVTGGDSSAATKGEAILTGKSGPILEVNQVSRAYNKVRYECLAQNSLGISHPAEVSINVLYPPRPTNTTESGHVFVGSSKHLQCWFDGNPQPEIKWYYQDPLSRSATSVLIDNSKDWDQKPKTMAGQQELAIRNVTYRNEGEYFCEAKNVINGQTNTIRSSPINLDVIGEPQFLAKSPVYAKAVQGSKSDISLTFCADPAPTKVYWQFGSIRVEVKTPKSIADQRVPSGVGQLSARQHHQSLNSRYQAQALQVLQKRDSFFSKEATCFEATLTLLEPEMSDQRDYSLMVHNDQGVSSGFVRVRVTSPLSPALMITSAFVFICGLFLCSLFFLFIFKKRQQFVSGARRANNGSVHSGQTNGTSNGGANSNERRRTSRKDKNLLVVASELANGGGQLQKSNGTSQSNGHNNHHQASQLQQHQSTNSNGQQQQTKGVVSGSANGLANGSINPAVNQLVLDEHQPTTKGGLVHGLMSMASSDTSCNDQKQLLASNCSDRNSSVGGGSSNGVAIDVGTSSDHYHNNTNTTTSSGNTTGRSTANSSPSPLNHISVDDELNLNGTYQATEPITQGAELSPPLGLNGGVGAQSGHHLNGQSALIYANIDYTNHQQIRRPAQLADNGMDNQEEEEDDDDSYNGHLAGHHQDMRRNQQQSPDASTMSLNKKSASLLAQRRRQQTPQLSPSGSNSTVQENYHQQQQRSRSPPEDLGSPVQSGSARPSVGATIALMNSLAAAQSAAAAAISSPVHGQPGAGVLNGAISQQLMANSANRVRKPGPPKPPKPSIQQRSRFYQQQLQQQANSTNGGGLVMIGDSQLGVYPISNDERAMQQAAEPDDESASAAGPNDLAVEYSRLAFPARAEL